MNGQTADIENYTITLDDDPVIPHIIERILGMPNKAFESGKLLIEEGSKLAPIAAFIDVHLNNSENGLDLISTLREYWPHCPIVVITHDDIGDNIEKALSQGANDFIKKPIQPQELESRLKARLRDFASKSSTDVFELYDLSVDRLRRVVKSNNGVRYVTPMDINILTVLHKNIGKVVKRDELKQKCWGNASVTDNALNRKVHEIRNVVKELSNSIELKTIYGVGFSIESIKTV